MRKNTKCLLYILLSLCLIGFYISLKTAPVKEIPKVKKVVIERMPTEHDVVCNEFNIAYYKFRTSPTHYTYTPVYKHWPSGDVTVMTCAEYEAYINSTKK